MAQREGTKIELELDEATFKKLREAVPEGAQIRGYYSFFSTETDGDYGWFGIESEENLANFKKAIAETARDFEGFYYIKKSV